LSLGPWDGPDIAADRQVALEQMIPITTRYAIAGKESPLQLARDWLHSQSCYYADYLAHIRLVEHGNVVARLNDIGARYMLEPGRNYVRIVLSNGDVAATIGREFW
jgi:hypothetical protein